ncbi:MAG: response regulator [Pseudomonadales bacterium]|nr:response regulator [Pseudomonadales bacterium]
MSNKRLPNRPIRIVVVDDEEPARNELCFQLKQIDEVDIIGEAADGIQALQLIKSLKPDLALLDIQMPGLTGFEVARELVKKKTESQVVFVTAYDHYAIEAFEINAIDYLLKPVEPLRLQHTLERVRNRQRSDSLDNTGPKPFTAKDLERIGELMEKRHSRPDPIAVKVGGKLVLVQSEDIIFISLENETIKVVTRDLRGFSNHRTLDELQSNLDPSMFWRVHRSHIANIHKIKEIIPRLSRNYVLKMADQKHTQIPVSRTQTKRLREFLKL